MTLDISWLELCWRKRNVAAGRDWKCSKCSCCDVGAGGVSPSAREEAKKESIVVALLSRPGTDISTLCLTMLLQRPQSYGHYCHVVLQLSDAVAINLINYPILYIYVISN